MNIEYDGKKVKTVLAEVEEDNIFSEHNNIQRLDVSNKDGKIEVTDNRENSLQVESVVEQKNTGIEMIDYCFDYFKKTYELFRTLSLKNNDIYVTVDFKSEKDNNYMSCAVNLSYYDNKSVFKVLTPGLTFHLDEDNPLHDYFVARIGEFRCQNKHLYLNYCSNKSHYLEILYDIWVLGSGCAREKLVSDYKNIAINNDSKLQEKEIANKEEIKKIYQRLTHM